MQTLYEAVMNKRVISAIYRSGAKRELEVHCVGVANNSDEILVRAYERYSGFKLLKFSELKNIKLLDKSFFIRPKYNDSSDSAMSEILFQVQR